MADGGRYDRARAESFRKARQGYLGRSSTLSKRRQELKDGRMSQEGLDELRRAIAGLERFVARHRAEIAEIEQEIEETEATIRRMKAQVANGS